MNLVPTAAQGKTAVALRYAVAPMCVAVAALLQVSPAGELSQPIGYFVLGVVAAGWFGGSGPGILAAFLSALVLPHLIAAIYPQWPVYALFAGYFDLPRFIVLGLTGFVVGWGTASLRRTQRQLSKVREKLETTVAERTANLAESEARYARAMEATGAGHTDWNLVTGEFYVSPRLLEILGHPPGATFADRADWVRRFPFHPEDRPKWQAAVDAHLASREAKFKNEWRIVVRGETRWVAFTFIATRDAAGKPVRWSGSVADITEQKRAAALLAGEKHLLEMMARGTPLSTVLDALCRIIEENVSGGLCGISLVDATGTVLDNGASPSLPRGYMQAIAGKAMERDAGPCCMAAVLNEQVIAADVATETRWPAWCTLALSHGLRAIWSTPITSSANKALGTFAIYFMRPSRPTHEQLAIIERFSHAAAVAIERSNAEQSLRQSEERYALAVAGSDDGVWDVDFVSGRVFLSARARELSGLPPGPELLPLAEFLGLLPIHPEDVPRREAALQAHLTGEAAAYEGEFRLRQLDGIYRWRRIHGLCVRGADGKPQRMAGSFADVDARRRAEEALRLSEERYALALEASKEGHFDNDLETGQIFASARVNEIYGFQPHATIGNRIEFVKQIPFHPDDRDAVLAALSKPDGGKRAGDFYEIQCRIIPRPGEIRWIHSRAKLVRDAEGRPRRRVGVVADITERKLAEEALRLSQERYAFAMEAAQDAHWDWIVGSEQYYTSPRAVDILGFPPGTTFSSRQDYLARTPLLKEDLELWQRATQDLFAGSGSRLSMELRAIINGEVRWIQHNGLCVRDASGRVVRWCGSVRDTTERRRAEEALRLSEERYALAMRASGEGHWDWKIGSDEFYASPRYLEIGGFPPDMPYTRRADIVERIAFHPEDRARYQAAVAAHFAGETPRMDIVVRIVPNGELRWLHVIGMCSRDEAGKPVRWAGSVNDITESKLAEEARRLSEERYALAMEVSEEGHFDWNVQTDTMFASAHLRRVLDIPADAEYRTRGDAVGNMPFYPGDGERVAQMTREVLAGSALQHEFEYRLLRGKEKQLRWIHARWKIFRDLAGLAQRVIGVVSDITERKQAEEALRRSEAALRLSEERYALAMEASEEGHFDWNPWSDAIFASVPMKKVLGLPADREYRTRDEMSAEVHYCAGERERLDQMTRQVLASEAEQHEFEYQVMRGGQARWVRRNWKITRDAGGVALRVTGVLTDITERRRVEEALRQSEERYTVAVDGASQGIFDWDLRTDRVFHSRRAQELFGVEPGEAWRARREWAALIRYHPEDVPRIRASIHSSLNGEKPMCGDEYRVMPREGEVRWLHQRGVVLRDASGKAYRMAGSIEDITERKVAAQALRESEARFRALTDLSSDWYWQQDETLHFTYSSAAVRTPTGHPGGSSIGLARWELPGIVPLSSTWEEHKALVAARKPFRDFEYSRPAIDGSGIRYISVSGTPIFDDKGEFRGYHGVGRTITERKRFEEELRSRKEMLEVAQQSARAVPWQWTNGADPEVNKWSPEMCALFGLPPGAFDGTTEGWWKLCHPDDRPRVKASIAHAFATGEVDVEYRVTLPDGTLRWLNQRGRAFFDNQGKPLRSIGFMFDITERHKVQDDLRSRQEMLELAQKSARAIAFEWRIGETGEGENRWSPDLEAMYGFAPGTYDGTFDAWRERVHRDDWPRVREAIEHAQRTGEVASEYRVVHPDGSTHWLQARGRLFFDGGGKPARMVGFMQDVTERKHAEMEVRQLEQKLRRAQRLEAMGTLAGGIAHDFNNILGAILGYGEMAMRDAKKGSRLRRDLDAIMAAGERGQALVDRILAFSRSGVGERVPVHVEEVVREALDQLAAHLPENVTIAPRLRAGRAAMLGDSTQVHQVVMNLANNAVQAMPHGGVLRVTLEDMRLEASRPATVGAIAAGDYIVLKIADSGTGIAADVLERMFDPFFTTKEVGVGSGLGLSLVHGIIAGVGGAIDVATQLGKGSSFTVYLPRSGDAPAQAEDENRPLPRGEGQRVLIVDDEEPLVRLASETLEHLGYAPVGFTSSINALQEFGANPGRFDVILTDERMPGITGSTIIREVRRINPSIPIVLMSGFVGASVSSKARELGANDVLKKPLLARELATSLARVLRPSA